MKKQINIVRIPGMGIGPECVSAASEIIEVAVDKHEPGHKISWIDAELDSRKDWRAQLSNIVKLLEKYKVALKGPTESPEGVKSLNVFIRLLLQLFACVRPISWTKGVPSPLRRPEDYNFVIFRENTEDSYVAIECGPNTQELSDMQDLLVNKWGQSADKVASTKEMAIGLSIVTKKATENIARAGVQYAIDNKLTKVCIGAKDNIMEQTNGKFKQWSFELIEKEFGAQKVNEWGDYEIVTTTGHKILVNHRITDNLLQQMIMNPKGYEVVILMNFTGDVFTDGLSGLVGGIGLAPGVNKNNNMAIYEATHGTWPQAAGQSRANPGAITLSGAMCLEDLGLVNAAKAIRLSIGKCIQEKLVTEDLGKQMNLPKSQWLSTDEFKDQVILRIDS